MSILSGWQTKPLGEVIKDIGDGGTPNTNKKEYFGGTIPWVVIQDIRKEISSSKTTLTPLGLDSCSAKLWPAGSVILSTGATIGEVGLAKVPVSTKQGIHGIVCGDQLSSSFLYYKLQTLRDFLNANAQGSTIREVRATFLRTIPISFPTALPEQTKIAEILSTVDRAIEQTEALIVKQQRIKTGLMQDLLTRGIDEHGNLRSEQTHKFKDSPLGRIPVEWEVRTLDRLTKAIVDCPHTTPQFTQGGILVARTFNIKEGQFLGEQSYISNEEYKERILRLEPQKGDVIFTREAPVGEAFLIPVNFKVCLGQRTMLLRCVLNECLPEYLVEVIYSEDMRIRFDQKVGGTTNPHLNVGDVRSLAIKQPPIKEQLKITALLVEIRKTLNCYDQEKSKLRSIKTALMQDLLRQRTVEGDRIEYKAGWNPDPIIRTLCAFANDFENLGGGYVVIGQDCDESGMPIFPPTGVPENQLDRIQRELLGFCNQIQPPYFPLLSVERFEGRDLIVLWAPGGQNRAYKAPKSVTTRIKEYRYYIRRYASTIEARGDDEKELINLTARVPFDDRYNQAASIEDLSPRLMEEFLREVDSGLADEAQKLSIEALGRQMNVVGGPVEMPLPKNVGLLFFNETPDKFFPATQIDVVWFPEGAGGDRFEEKIFKGPLARMTLDALGYIQRNYLKETVIKHPNQAEAERVWNFPYAAVEEAIVNAVYHRSYEEREPIEVRITPDEMTVLSFPGPDRSIRMEDLRAGRAISRRYRNRRIGEFLKELELTEGRSTGIPKIMKVMKDNGSPSPVFETDDDRTSFLIRFPVNPKGAPENAPQVTPHVTPQVTPQVERLIATVEREMTRSELMDALLLKDRMHFSRDYLQPALKKGLLEMTIPDKPRSGNQRYRLTDKGRILKEEL